MSDTKTFVYINRKAPYGSIYALESLEVVLIGAAFEQNVKLVFMDDGVFQLTRNQNPEAIGMKNFSKTYAALGDYDVNQIYIDQQSLEQRGLGVNDLQALVYEDEEEDWAEKSSIHLVNREELSDIIDSADVLLNF